MFKIILKMKDFDRYFQVYCLYDTSVSLFALTYLFIFNKKIARKDQRFLIFFLSGYFLHTVEIVMKCFSKGANDFELLIVQQVVNLMLCFLLVTCTVL